MSTLEQEDRDYSITRNFQFKKNYSDNSLEVIAYNVVTSGESTVENREYRKEWLNDLLAETQMGIDEIIGMKSSGRNADGEEISKSAQEVAEEQVKLKILHMMNWVYDGSFHPDADKTYKDNDGVDKKISTLYPELSFRLRTVRRGSSYLYEASYGIMRGATSPEYGTYSYFATINEALDFLSSELQVIGRKKYFNRLMKKRIGDELARIGVKKPNKDRYREIYRKNQQAIVDRVNRDISKNNIEETLHTVKRSTDIFVLPDLIERILMPISEQYLSAAKENEFRAIKAKNIMDTDIVDLDGDQSTDTVEIESAEDVLANAQRDGIRKVEAQQKAIDFEPQDSSHTLFDVDGDNAPSSVPLTHVTDDIDITNTPTVSPDGAKYSDANKDSSEDSNKGDTKSDKVVVSEHTDALQSPISTPPAPPVSPVAQYAVSVDDHTGDNTLFAHQGGSNDDAQAEVSSASITVASDVSNTLVSDSGKIDDTNSIAVSDIPVESSMIVVSAGKQDIPVGSNAEHNFLIVSHDQQSIVVSNTEDIVDTFDVGDPTPDFNPHTITVDARQKVVDTLVENMEEMTDSSRFPLRDRQVQSLADDMMGFLG